MDDLLRCRAPEVLVHGAAGTGKSYGIGQHLLGLLSNYPGCRIAVIRKTRVSLTESWLVTWETKVLADGIDATVLTVPLDAGAGRANRSTYEFKNGSVLTVGGMDNPTRLFSTEYDLIYVNEANELTEGEWESLHRALRNGVLPFQQLLGDCNPDADTHWLWKRCKTGLTLPLQSRHQDNPTLETPAGKKYLERLSRMTGVRRKRLFEGLWVGAEGQIFEEAWNADRNVIDAIPLDAMGRPIVRQYVAGVDWGFRAPGCIQVWGVDGDGREYLVRESYRVQKTIDWWIGKAREMSREYRIRHFACDPAEPGFIEQFKRAGLPIREHERTENEWRSGIDRVRDYMQVADDGKPRLFVLRNALEERDPLLDEDSKPCGLLEEIPQFIYDRAADGRPIKEKPDPTCADHAADVARYVTMYVDRYCLGAGVGSTAERRERSRERPEPLYRPGTLGNILGHEEQIGEDKEWR